MIVDLLFFKFFLLFFFFNLKFLSAFSSSSLTSATGVTSISTLGPRNALVGAGSFPSQTVTITPGPNGSVVGLVSLYCASSCTKLTNPDFDAQVSCSRRVRVGVVVDESGSVLSEAANVRTGLTNLFNGFAQSQGGVDAYLIYFSTGANLEQGYTPVTSTAFTTAISNYAPAGSTNWEAPLIVALAQSPLPDLLIFIRSGLLFS